MAEKVDPRKKHNFSISIAPDPINPMLFQKVTLPDMDIAVAEHGHTNHNIKTGGRVSFSNLLAEKLLSSKEADTYMWNWAASVADPLIGGGTIPEIYKKVIIVTEFAEDGTTPVDQHIYEGCWPCKINGQELDRMSDADNSIESVEFCVDTGHKL